MVDRERFKHGILAATICVVLHPSALRSLARVRRAIRVLIPIPILILIIVAVSVFGIAHCVIHVVLIFIIGASILRT